MVRRGRAAKASGAQQLLRAMVAMQHAAQQLASRGPAPHGRAAQRCHAGRHRQPTCSAARPPSAIAIMSLSCRRREWSKQRHQAPAPRQQRRPGHRTCRTATAGRRDAAAATVGQAPPAHLLRGDQHVFVGQVLRKAQGRGAARHDGHLWGQGAWAVWRALGTGQVWGCENTKS